MAKDRTKTILKELRALRDEMHTRLDELEERIGSVEGGGAAAAGSSPSSPRVPQITTLPQSPRPGEDRMRATQRDVTVTVKPLSDVGLARVVEDAVTEIKGVESASLRELSGDSAVLDVKVEGEVALISGLRHTLPVAFDVTESDNSSFTIALVQPRAEREDGVAVREDQ